MEYLIPVILSFLVVLGGLFYFISLSRRRWHHIVSLRKRIDELRAIANTDSLTGLLTRREFERVFEAFINLLRGDEERRHNEMLTSLAVLVIDIDHFKHINDQHGHLNGDKVLRKVSETIKGSLRDMDPVCRWGGEEIVIAMPGASEEVAVMTAEKIRAAVESICFAINDLKVTVSVGVSCVYHSKDSGHLIEWADNAVYKAKENGRNRVVVYSSSL